MQRSAVLALVLAVAPGSRALADTLRVPEEHPTIQGALVASSDGDVISVAPGTYREVLNFLGKEVLVESREGPAATIVRGTLEDSVVHFIGGEGPGAELRGFTITGGGGAWLPDGEYDRFGGGIVIVGGSSPTIRGNWIKGNETIEGGEGAGIYVGPGCNPLILGNWIAGNSTEDYYWFGAGGGIAVVEAAPTIRRNRIEGNSSNFGGGVYLWDSAALVAHNEIVSNGGSWWSSAGGGIGCGGNAAPTIRDNLIAGNHVNDDLVKGGGAPGGGIYCSCDAVVIERNRIHDNGAVSCGGGIYLRWVKDVVVRDNLITGNSSRGDTYGGGYGGGVCVSGTVLLEGNTFAENRAEYGSAISVWPDHEAVLSGCIVWDNGPSPIEGIPARVEYCDIEGGGSWTGPYDGNLDVDPQFTDPGNGDYSLRSFSPCIDAGPPRRWTSGPELTGTPRMLDGDLDRRMVVDMGALEYSHVRLEVSFDPKEPVRRLEIRTRGTAGMEVFLFVGYDPGEFVLGPYGSALIDLNGPYHLLPFGTIPGDRSIPLPPDLPPVAVFLQELAVVPGGKGGNFSNVVRFRLE